MGIYVSGSLAFDRIMDFPLIAPHNLYHFILDSRSHL